MNVWDVLILVFAALAVGLAVFFMLRRRRRCGPGCGSCPYAQGCAKKEKKE